MSRHEEHSGKGGADIIKDMHMPSDMLTPLTAGKDGAEPGPAAPKGQIDWEKKDPTGILPKGYAKE